MIASAARAAKAQLGLPAAHSGATGNQHPRHDTGNDCELHAFDPDVEAQQTGVQRSRIEVESSQGCSKREAVYEAKPCSREDFLSGASVLQVRREAVRLYMTFTILLCSGRPGLE